MNEKNMLLSMRGITKSFGGVPVLKDVDINVARGEVHALMGENGAGKSTLIKILMGVYPKDSGEIIYDGQVVEINTRKDAARIGIAVIYQELSLISTLTVTQNVMLGKEYGWMGILNRKTMRKEVNKLIEYYGFDLDQNAVVETLSIAQRQTVEILKALSEEASLIIMDEPTASLSSKESETLFRIINQLREKGISILYISHRLEEIFRLSDRITVLRDGRKVGNFIKEEVEPADIVRMMIGKKLDLALNSGKIRKSQSEPFLEVKNLCCKGIFYDINFTAHKGEILGIGGLVGSGRTEVLRCIFGADHYDFGEILIKGKKIKSGVGHSVKNGVGMIPEDRRTQGFVPLLSVARNIAAPNYDKLSRCAVVNGRA